MSTSYRRQFYRAAFLLLCVAPTIYTIGWIVERRVAAASAAAQAASLLPAAELELARLLGVKVTIGSLEYPTSTTTLLTDLQLHDLETEALLATARAVTMYYAEEGEMVIEPTGLEVQASQLARLGAMLHGRILRELPASVRVEGRCEQVQVVGGPREETLADCDFSLRQIDGERQALATFRPAWKSTGEPLTLRVVRHTRRSQPATSISLDTGRESLPASWFEFALPHVAKLGDACQVQGTFTAREEQERWESSFSGVLEQIELDRIVARRLRPYPLGTARLKVEHARWQAGRLLEAEGLIEADALRLSWRVLTEYFSALGLPAQPVLSEQNIRGGSVASNGTLRCLFTLDAHGLVLLGEQGIVLRDGATPLLGQPTGKLPWSPALVTLCRDLGCPSLASVPPEFQQGSSGVQLRSN